MVDDEAVSAEHKRSFKPGFMSRLTSLLLPNIKKNVYLKHDWVKTENFALLTLRISKE